MPTSFLTDHETALREAVPDDGVPAGIDVWKRTVGTGRYEIDTDASVVEFVTRKFKLYPVEGRFHDVAGHIDVVDPLERSEVELRVMADSVDTGVGLRDAHLRSSQYLAAEEHRELRFVSEHVQPLGGDTFALHGQLTIRDHNEPAVFHATLIDTFQVEGATAVTFIATAEIERRAFDVPSSEAVALWGLVVDPVVRVRLRITARAEDG